MSALCRAKCQAVKKGFGTIPRESTTREIRETRLTITVHGRFPYGLFVLHTYVGGAVDRYAKLKRACRAEIDEARSSTNDNARSYLFEPPSSGKIALKIISRHGEEVWKDDMVQPGIPTRLGFSLSQFQAVDLSLRFC
jgi:hypothetical protein